MNIYANSFLNSIVEPIKNAFIEMYKDFAELLPKVIVAVVILGVGYLIASFLIKVIAAALIRIKFDGLLERVGVASVLTRIGMKGSPSAVISKVLFWVAMLFIIKNAAAQLGIEDIEKLIVSMITFMPKVILSGIIMLIGFMVAEMVQNATRAGLESFNLDYAKPLSNILFGFVFVIVLTVALDQLGIQTELLNASVKIILAALGLAMAIALGMGLRSLAKAIVAGVYARDVYKVGTEIEIDGELAKVAGVGPVTTKLQNRDGGFLMIPNAELIEQRVKGRSAE